MDDVQKVMEDLWLLSNNGKSMRDLTLLGRNALNGINQSVVEVNQCRRECAKGAKGIAGLTGMRYGVLLPNKGFKSFSYRTSIGNAIIFGRYVIQACV
jgi:hypothetical protein